MEDHRQNLLNLFRRRGIGFAPVDFSLSPAMVDKFEEKFGHRDYAEEFGFSIRSPGASFLKQEFTDWKEKYYPHETFNDTVYFDAFGVARESTPESMHMSRMYHPMAKFSTLKEFESYPYPVFDPERTEACRKQVAEFKENRYFVAARMQCTVWEHAWYMRSMEELMMGMMCGDELADYHLDRICDLACRQAAAYAEAGVDLIFLGDDIGMQKTIMMSRELYEHYLKNRLRKVIKAARQVNPDILIGYHSCGYVKPFIDDLIEVGVDVLNPVQPECMEFKEIYDEFGQRLSFWGTLGTQTLFPFGTPDEVYRETLKNLNIAGRNGGLLAAPTHLVEPEVPLENIIAYVQACRDYC